MGWSDSMSQTGDELYYLASIILGCLGLLLLWDAVIVKSGVSEIHQAAI